MSKYINYCVLVLLWIIFFHFCLGNYLSQEWGRWRFPRCCSGHVSGRIRGFLSTFIHYSYSRDVGGGSGSSFSTEGEGRITAIRVWEIYGAYITGIQLRYDNSWADVVGRIYDTPQEMELFDGEAIDQISGKFDNNYIYQVIFGTSRGRSLTVGQPTQGSFNFYPNHPDAELRLLSGRFNGNGIMSLGAHWGVVFTH
ncbi:zymogen granule membrane protein 16-like [Oreochromis aureus]|uniref:zymogen granule membrane protein 16-like n=1 Tax=Oreochromis aureus TaxID=47969 RepID=UPI0019539C0C|nr:zymogen granule membrane protein 16-like [Oreochromis aureus]